MLRKILSDLKFYWEDVVCARSYASKGKWLVSPNRQLILKVQEFGCRHVAEIGIGQGATSIELAKYLQTLDGETSLHLFDFERKLSKVVGKIKSLGYESVFGYGNTEKLLDSYNWSLMLLIQKGEYGIFDYIYLDGAHTWAFDALAFLLSDRLLKVGGYFEMDDYMWSISKSPTINPRVFPQIRRMYSDEQINENQVRLVIDLLVKTDKRYAEILPNRLYKKIA